MTSFETIPQIVNLIQKLKVRNLQKYSGPLPQNNCRNNFKKLNKILSQISSNISKLFFNAKGEINLYENSIVYE